MYFFMFIKVLEEREMLSKKPPLLIKIAPDLTTEGMKDIAAVATSRKVGLYQSRVLTWLQYQHHTHGNGGRGESVYYHHMTIGGHIHIQIF